MTLAEQDQLGRELIDISKRLNKLESTIERLMASRAIHMDSVGTPKAIQTPFETKSENQNGSRRF